MSNDTKSKVAQASSLCHSTAETAVLQSDGRAALVAKLVEVMGAIDSVPKSHRTASGPDFYYAATDDFLVAVRPELVKRNLLLVSSIEDVRERRVPGKDHELVLTGVVLLVTVIDGDSGASLQFKMAGEAMDSGDKALSKAITSAEGSAVRWLFLIPTAEKAAYDKHAKQPSRATGPDDVPAGVDSRTGEADWINRGQQKNLETAMRQTGTTLEEVLERAGVAALEEIPRRMYLESIVPALKKRLQEIRSRCSIPMEW